MTPVEWTAVKRHVESLWGKTSKWAGYGHLINQVGHVSYEDAIRVVDQHVDGGFAPSPADIVAIRLVAVKVAELAYIPRVCGDHDLGLVDGPFSPPFRACRNVGCDYQTSKDGDQER